MDEDYEIQRIIDAHPACKTAENGTGARCTCVESCANYWLRAKGYKGLTPHVVSHDEYPASTWYDPEPKHPVRGFLEDVKWLISDSTAIFVISGVGWCILAVVFTLLTLAFGPVMLYVVLGCAAFGALSFALAFISCFIK